MIKVEAGQIPQNTLVRVKLWGFEDGDNGEVTGVMRFIPDEQMILFVNSRPESWEIRGREMSKQAQEFTEEFPQYKRGWWIFEDSHVEYMLFQNEE